MKIKTNIMQKKFYSIGLLVLGLIFSAQINAQDVRLERLGGYSSGVFDEGAAEIVSYDKGGEKLYFINAEAGTVGVLDISDASNPVLEATINVASDVPNTGGLNAVAAGPNFFAVAVEHDDKQANGYIAFYQLDRYLLMENMLYLRTKENQMMITITILKVQLPL
jgi:hypothetical protein